MNRWITRAILAATTAAFFPMPLHADATLPPPATRPSDLSDPFLIMQQNRELQRQYGQAQRDLRQLKAIPSPTRIPSVTTPYNDPRSWGLILVSPPTTQPWRTFQFDGVTVSIQPVTAEK